MSLVYPAITQRPAFTRRRLVLVAATAPRAWGASVKPDLSDIPNFCSHEHWGSIDSIGQLPEGFRADLEQGARPRGKTGLMDLLLEPYFRSNLTAAGAKFSVADLKKLPAAEALNSLGRALDPQRLTGTYQCTRRGMQFLYGADVSELNTAATARLDQAIARNYEHHLDWYRAAMKKAHFSELIRPVHPEFYFAKDSAESAAAEQSFTRTVMRIDPLLDLWRDQGRKKRLAAMVGVEPSDAATWRLFLAKLFDIAARNGAVGIKQLQAYRRDLNFAVRPDADAVWQGNAQPAEVRAFQDWAMHECCRQAHERGWPHQVHVGTHNITQSSPMPLLDLARRYPAMKIVMIHCWPFLKEAGWLAKYQANMYIDTCWQPILNPAFFAEAMQTWLTYVPLNKITCGHDATTVEMAAGSSLFTREILGQALGNAASELGIDGVAMQRMASDLLHNNAVEIYRFGQRLQL